MNISLDFKTGIVTVDRCGQITRLDLSKVSDVELFKLAMQQMHTLSAFHKAMTTSEVEKQLMEYA